MSIKFECSSCLFCFRNAPNEDVAEEILNKCTVAENLGNSLYEVAFNYEFIEDFRDNAEE